MISVVEMQDGWFAFEDEAGLSAARFRNENEALFIAACLNERNPPGSFFHVMGAKNIERKSLSKMKKEELVAKSATRFYPNSPSCAGIRVVREGKAVTRKGNNYLMPVGG